MIATFFQERSYSSREVFSVKWTKLIRNFDKEVNLNFEYTPSVEGKYEVFWSIFILVFECKIFKFHEGCASTYVLKYVVHWKESSQPLSWDEQKWIAWFRHDGHPQCFIHIIIVYRWEIFSGPFKKNYQIVSFSTVDSWNLKTFCQWILITEFRWRNKFAKKKIYEKNELTYGLWLKAELQVYWIVRWATEIMANNINKWTNLTASCSLQGSGLS